ncbi:Carbamoyl-phosphate synthase small chain [Levilactobacillus brevis]|nr:Carbamoyl-phosphate synthase small chain [Levilactobacillus brevis]
MIRTVQAEIPLFAIGLGHELFALANGAELKMLPVEYHGSGHPIRRIVTNDIIYATQGQGYAVVAKSIDRDRLITTYVDLINGTVQGLRHRDFPAFSVQFFADGAPGPHESRDLFDEFMEAMTARGGISLPSLNDIQKVLIIGGGPTEIGHETELDSATVQIMTEFKNTVYVP